MSEKEIFRKYPNYFEPLDKEEEQLMNDLNNGLYVANNDEKEKHRISGLFKEFSNENKKDGLFTIRINKKILEEVRKVAGENGLSYQNFINMLLFKVAKKELTLRVDAI